MEMAVFRTSFALLSGTITPGILDLLTMTKPREVEDTCPTCGDKLLSDGTHVYCQWCKHRRKMAAPERRVFLRESRAIWQAERKTLKH
jgi:tRNA(Ile2) C34 agmatinyltransferase TiaS